MDLNTPQQTNNNQPPQQHTTLIISIVVVAIVLAAAIFFFWYLPQENPPGLNGNIRPPGTLPPPAEDREAPSIPSRPAPAAISDKEVVISWNASTDDMGVEGYRIYRNGALAGTSKTTLFRDADVRPASSYTYTVTAFDDANRESPASSEVLIQLLPAPIGEPSSPVSDTIQIQMKNGATLTVRNFYKNAVEITPYDYVVIKDTFYYRLLFFEKDNGFLVSIKDPNVETARAVAELELPDILGLAQQELCNLDIFITVPFYVSETRSGKSYTLSFCPQDE